MKLRGVVMAITQDEPNFCRNFPQQLGGGITVRYIGRRQHRRNGKPDGSDNADHMQFPAIHPAMPARFGPMGLGINRGVWDLSLFAMFLMPDAAARSQDGTVDGNGSPTGDPGLDEVDQVTT